MDTTKLKYVLIGMVVGVALVFFVGAAYRADAPGRYQISATNNHVLILDTQEGIAKHFDTFRGEIKVMYYNENMVKTVKIGKR